MSFFPFCLGDEQRRGEKQRLIAGYWKSRAWLIVIWANWVHSCPVTWSIDATDWKWKSDRVIAAWRWDLVHCEANKPKNPSYGKWIWNCYSDFREYLCYLVYLDKPTNRRFVFVCCKVLTQKIKPYILITLNILDIFFNILYFGSFSWNSCHIHFDVVQCICIFHGFYWVYIASNSNGKVMTKSWSRR